MAVQGVRYLSNITVNLIVTGLSTLLARVVPPPINYVLAKIVAWITQKLI